MSVMCDGVASIHIVNASCKIQDGTSIWLLQTLLACREPDKNLSDLAALQCIFYRSKLNSG